MVNSSNNPKKHLGRRKATVIVVCEQKSTTILKLLHQFIMQEYIPSKHKI